jgi:EF-P beta-lysylation protein EpmB
MPDWKRQLSQSITSVDELLEFLQLDSCVLSAARHATKHFPLRVPYSFAERMQKGNLDDPLLRQVLPLTAETLQTPGYSIDPVGDLGAMPRLGLLHKYHGRVLLLTTGACAIHCRYCFRRHFPYAKANPLKDKWEEALDYVASNRDITEVILSGGDPLVLSDRRLSGLAARLGTIPHVRCLRLHTRLPIVLPDRIDHQLLGWMTDVGLRKVVVIHTNHANELDESVGRALNRLTSSGAILLNQAVLLRGINDSVEALSNLSEALIHVGVLPYYLHLLDKVQGAAHFDVPKKHACALIKALNGLLPGYLVPRLANEQAGAPSKRLLI